MLPVYVQQLHPIGDMSPSQFEAALHRIDRATASMMAARHVPGLEMAIVKDDKVVWLKGYGYRNLEKKLPMTPDTITQIASCSKAFTSTLALMAAQDGKLALNDPVRAYLPYFHLKDPDADANMTVADLMCHSSGLPRTDAAWIFEKLNPQQCVELLGNCEPTFLFRENAQYSNIMVNTAAMATSAACGEPWGDLLKEKITGPLGMTSTSIEDPTRIDPNRMSIGYWFDPLSGRVERERYLAGNSIYGAGAVKSCARDLAQWLRFHLGGGTFEGRRLLDSSILAEAYKPRQQAGDDSWFGLGWIAVTGRPAPVIEHGGDLPGFQSLVCLLPSKHIGIAFSDNNDAAGLREPLLGMILDNLIGKRDHKWDAQPAKEQGTFVDPTARHLLRTFYDGSLWAILDQGKAIRLSRKGWRSYETADRRNPDLRLAFWDDPKLRVSLTQGGVETEYRRSVKFNAGITVPALMAKMVAAYGGESNLSKPLTVQGRYDADLRQEGLRVSGLLERSNDDLGYMEMLYDGHSYLGNTLQGVNAASGGGTESGYRLFPLLGSDLVDAQLDADVCQALNWRAKFSRVEIIARQDLGGEPVWVVRQTPAESPNEILEFVSERSGLVLRREAGNPASVSLFSDFRPVDGVILPYGISLIDSSFHREDIRVGEYAAGNRYPHWAFNPIGSAKTP